MFYFHKQALIFLKILQVNGMEVLCGHLLYIMIIFVYFMAILIYFPSFRMLHQEKSGNPGADTLDAICTQIQGKVIDGGRYADSGADSI
jgi:hypothetical protein